MAARSADLLARIDHVVVLMLEGRSFDSVLGHLHGLPEDAVNLLRREGLPDQPHAAWSEGGRTWPQLTSPSPAPASHFADIQQQIYGLPEPLPEGAPHCDVPGELGAMGGFVQSYARRLMGRPDTTADDTSTPVGHVMNVLHPDQLPVTSELARTFKVVDSYFASAPCSALPNRAFAVLGTAGGHVDALDAAGLPHAPYFGLSIFGQARWATHLAATEGGEAVDWRVYFGDFPLSLAFTDTWGQLDQDHLRPFSRFKADAAAGELPALTWVEPAWMVDPSDGQPPNDVTEAEALVARVYNALRASPKWSKTLLVLTYGSHGGCYDHVPPLRATPPGGRNPDGYPFDDTGVRVPCILVSDFTLDPGCSSTARPLVFDHTSILALLRQRWPQLELPLSDREEQARSLAELLREPQEGAPESLEIPEPLPEVVALRQQAFADAAELLAARAAGASWDSLKGMFLGDLAQLAELAVFTSLSPYLERLLELVSAKIPVKFLSRWVLGLDDELLALVHAFLADQDRHAFRVSELQATVGWLSRFVVTHHAEHLERPLVPARLAELRAAAGSPTELDRYEVIEGIQAFRQWLKETRGTG